jgi:hypothetical protein
MELYAPILKKSSSKAYLSISKVTLYHEKTDQAVNDSREIEVEYIEAA